MMSDILGADKHIQVHENSHLDLLSSHPIYGS